MPPSSDEPRRAWPRPRVLPERFVTHDLPGIGGRLKQRPEDFLVDEQPLIQPTGEGEHVMLYVQKRGMSTFDLVGVLASHFGVVRSAVGYAGLKDKTAITRQAVTVHVPGKGLSDFRMLEHASVSIEWADMHTSKLKPGRLAGNRFSIRVRGVGPTDALAAKRVLDRLAEMGVPNRFGEQRFGAVWRNHLVGAADVLGDARGVCDALLMPSAEFPGVDAEARELYEVRDFNGSYRAMPRGAAAERRVVRTLANKPDYEKAAGKILGRERRFFHSAMQSAAFNAVLDDRLERGTLDTLVAGDLAWKHDSGAVFAVDRAMIDSGELDERLGRFEISPSGPIWGAEMTRASGETDRAELAALGELGLTPADLERADAAGVLQLHGARRALRVPLMNHEVEGGMDEHGGYVRCAFDLPPGSYATVVMREVMKADVADLSEPLGISEANEQ